MHFIFRLFIICLTVVLLVSLCAAVVVQRTQIDLLRARIESLEQLVAVQGEWCNGLQRVNDVCEISFQEIAQRLGLDRKWQPLISTALWRRVTRSMPIVNARREMGASRIQAEPPLGLIEN